MEFNFEEFEELEMKKTLNKGNSFDNKLVRIGSTLARQLHFSEREEKLFAMAISQVDFFCKK